MGHEEKSTRLAGIGFVLAVYAASRLFYLVWGYFVAKLLPMGDFQRGTSDVPLGSLNIWAHWDGEHYVALTLAGYSNPPRYVAPAFFPMYPLIMQSFSGLTGGPLSQRATSDLGVLISLLILPIGFYFVYAIARDGWDERVARGTLLALAFFPTTFFFNAVYTESLFLALSAGSLWAMRVKRNLLLACLLAGLATATRNIGIFLIVPLLYDWIQNGGIKEARERWRGVYLALVPLGLVTYMAYLLIRFGDPLLFYSSQKNWGREATGLLTTVTATRESAVEGARLLRDPELWAHPSPANLADHLGHANPLVNLVFLVFALVILLLGLRRSTLSLTLYGLLLVAFPAFFGKPDNPLMGTPRYVLLAFPMFIVLGLLAKHKYVFGGWLVLSTVSSMILCALFVTWRFVA